MLADKAGIKSQQQGVGMVEILVTLLILSVGLLGVAQLQFIGTMSNADALHRSQSVMIAQQMSERLRANAFMSTNSNGMIVDNGYFNSNIYNFDNLTCGGALNAIHILEEVGGGMTHRFEPHRLSFPWLPSTDPRSRVAACSDVRRRADLLLTFYFYPGNIIPKEGHSCIHQHSKALQTRPVSLS